MVRKWITVSLIFGTMCSYAGFFGTTTHSRANCAGFNESVTWWANHSFDWRVESHHFANRQASRPLHIINTGKDYNWRVAAYHATEAYSTRRYQYVRRILYRLELPW